MATNAGESEWVPDFYQLPLAEMEDTVARFEARVSAAQRAHPATKEFVRNALRRTGVSRCPVRLKRLSLDAIVRHGDALADLFCEFPDDAVFIQPYDIFVGYQPPGRKERIETVRVLMQAAEWTDEWGVRWGHAFGSVGAAALGHPIQDWSQLEDYVHNRMPDPLAPGRFDAARRTLEQHRETKYCVGMIHLALFERINCLRGTENTFVDLGTDEPRLGYLCEVLTSYLVGIVRQWGEMRADAVMLTEDWGSQTALMISPKMWRSVFKPYYQIVFDEIHRCGMDIFFHSCGNVTAIVPDLIDLGVDVLDPVQPGAMNQEEVARRWGGRISFSGGIDDQNLMRSGDPRQIKDAVRRLVDTLGAPFGHGLILSPANVMTPEAPIEMLRTLFEACHGQ